MQPAPQRAVWAAANAGDVAALQAALSAGGSTEEADRNGVSALAQAACKGHTQAVDTLLRASAVVNSKNKVGNVCRNVRNVWNIACAVDNITPDKSNGPTYLRDLIAK